MKVPVMQLLSSNVPACASDCEATTSVETLNRSCFCISLDERVLRKRLEADLGMLGLATARLYQGQTTNFRTPGGGFAPVFTQARAHDANQ